MRIVTDDFLYFSCELYLSTKKSGHSLGLTQIQITKEGECEEDND